MIISDSVDVKCSSSNKKTYEDKGYIRNDNGYFNINICDLSIGSKVKIKVKCDNCGILKEVIYKNYIKQTSNNKDKYYCSKCKYIKIKQTHLDKYGVDSLFKLTEFQNKIDNIMIEKYGVKDALSNKDILNKMVHSVKEKYNVDNISQLQKIKDKKITTLSKTWIKRLNKNSNLDIISGDYETKKFTAKCDQGKVHTFEISYDLYHNRKEFNSIICTKCHKEGRNIYGNEDKIVNFIKEHYNGKIILNSRKIIKPYELDIYLPELNLAIELNGFKWHSVKKVGKDYHKMKTEMCNKLNTQLLHFFQDDWIYKEDIMKSMILNKLNKTPNKIYARKCNIMEITNKQTKLFMGMNHIENYAVALKNYALLYNNEIVSVLSIGKRKINGKINLEIIRYGTKIYSNVIGGFSKLFKYMIKDLNPNEIITHANKSYSNGDLYIKNGFEYLYDTKPNFFYVINNIRKYHYSFIKDNEYDKKGINKIYDSGNKKFIKIIKNG